MSIMEKINIKYRENNLYIEVNIPNQRFAFLKYDTSSEPLSDYLPIKVLPINQDGYGKYELFDDNMIPEEATHIWVSAEDDSIIASAWIPNRLEQPIAKPKLVFCAISDLHTISKGGRQLKLQAEAFRHISNAEAAFVLIAGDLSNGVQTNEYNYSTTIGDIHIVSLQGVDYRNKIYLRENTKVKQILERHGNIWYFAGYTHDSLISDSASIRSNGTVIYINTASVGNTEPCAKAVKLLKAFRDKTKFHQLQDYFCRRSMGIRAELYDSYCILRGVDFIQNKYSSQCLVKVIFK